MKTEYSYTYTYKGNYQINPYHQSAEKIYVFGSLKTIEREINLNSLPTKDIEIFSKDVTGWKKCKKDMGSTNVEYMIFTLDAKSKPWMPCGIDYSIKNPNDIYIKD